MATQRISDASDEKLAQYWLQINNEVLRRLKDRPSDMGEAIRRQAVSEEMRLRVGVG